MIPYYISKTTELNGIHLMHRYACASLPEEEKDQILVGEFDTCEEALVEALKIESNTKGCPYCCRSCSK